MINKFFELCVLSVIGGFLFFGNSASAKVIQSASGFDTHCALLDNNQIKCWGLNAYGSLGIGHLDQIARGTFSTVDLGTGEKIVELKGGPFAWRFCVLFISGRVKCWGKNGSGELGLGDTNYRGDQAGEMGKALPYVDLASTADIKVKTLSLGFESGCALFSNNKMKCWGSGQYGQHGYSHQNSIGYTKDQMGDQLPFLDLGTTEKILQIDGGYATFCVLFESGRAKCWGFNGVGQLGMGSQREYYGGMEGQPIAQLPFINLGSEPATKIVAGVYHSCALFKSGRVKCWGYNSNGQLGYENTKTIGFAPEHMGDNLPFLNLGTNEKVIDLYSVYMNTCVLFESGRTKCWGSNMLAQLGSGDTNDRGGNPDDMGAKLPFINFGKHVKVSGITMSFLGICAILAPIFEMKCYGNNGTGQAGYPDGDIIGGTLDQLGDELPYIDMGE